MSCRGYSVEVCRKRGLGTSDSGRKHPQAGVFITFLTRLYLTSRIEVLLEY